MENLNFMGYNSKNARNGKSSSKKQIDHMCMENVAGQGEQGHSNLLIPLKN